MSEETRGRKKNLASSVETEAKKMRFNPLIMDIRYTITAKYPEFKKVEGLMEYYNSNKQDLMFKNRAIMYMVWLYSSDSILNVKPIEPLADRKYKAADLAGFVLNKRTNEFPGRVMVELFQFGDPLFVLAVLGYLKFLKADLFSEIIVCEEQHYEAMKLRLAPASGSSTKSVIEAADLKKKLRLECKELMTDIRSYWEEFWEDNLDLKVIGQGIVYKSIEDRAKINTGV